MSRLLSSEEQIALVTRLREGEAGAEAEFAHLFTGRLRMMIAARLRDRDAALDLAQEALIACLTAIRTGEPRQADRLAAFVHGVGRNVVNNYLRRQRGAPVEVPLAPDAAVTETTEEQVAYEERLALARRALTVLGVGEREVLSLSLLDGLKPGAICARLGLSAEVVRARKSRALKKVIAEVERLSRSRPGGH